jgi:hypothetical protein
VSNIRPRTTRESLQGLTGLTPTQIHALLEQGRPDTRRAMPVNLCRVTSARLCRVMPVNICRTMPTAGTCRVMPAGGGCRVMPAGGGCRVHLI